MGAPYFHESVPIDWLNSIITHVHIFWYFWFIHSFYKYTQGAHSVPGTVLGAEYTIESEQVKLILTLWRFQSSGEDGHRVTQTQSKSNNSDLG